MLGFMQTLLNHLILEARADLRAFLDIVAAFALFGIVTLLHNT